MHPDERLTILLVVNDRVRFTRRWLSYANAVRLPFRIVIADAGSDDAVERLLRTNEFPAVQFEYIKYPHHETYNAYWATVADAAGRLTTPFTALADDDDFFVLPGLSHATDFLEQHPEYVTCGGQCAIFWVGGAAARRRGRLSGSRVEWKCSLDDHSLTADSAGDRIQAHSLRVTHPAYHHVRRTRSLMHHAQRLHAANLADPFLMERLFFFLTAIEGKTRQLPGIFIARQWNTPNRIGLAHEAKFGDWLGRMLVPTWSADFSNFVDTAAAALVEREGLSRDAAVDLVVRLYKAWASPQMLGDIVAEARPTLRALLGRIAGTRPVRAGGGRLFPVPEAPRQ